MLMRPLPRQDTHPLPLWQTDLFARILRRVGTDAEVHIWGTVGQALILTRSFGLGNIRFTSRGPVWADGADAAEQITALRESGLHIINAEDTPPAVLRSAGFRQVFRAKQMAILPVFQNPSDQLAACHQKWRNAYRRGLETPGLKTVHRRFKPETDNWIFPADRAAQKQNGYRGLPAAFAQVMASTVPDAVQMSIATQRGETIAAMMFLHHGAQATYHIGWANDAGRAANAHRVLLLQAARKFARKDVQKIDLGLYDPANAAGLAQFKRRSGAAIKTLGGTWAKIPLL